MNLQDWANASQIATGAIAIFSVLWFLGWTIVHRCQLVSYLEREKRTATGNDQGKRTQIHLMARLGMSESQLFTAYFFAKSRIDCYVAQDENGLASKILFRYK